MDVISIYVPSFFIFVGMSIVSPILPLYAKSFDVSYTLVSLAISAYAFGRFLADIPSGLLSDKVGRRPWPWPLTPPWTSPGASAWASTGSSAT